MTLRWEMPAKGSHLGRWTLVKGLGEGGNSRVWLAESEDATTAAVKVLKPPEGTERYERFVREIETLDSALKDVDGVLPLLDFDLPMPSRAMTPPWLAMPVADSLRSGLGSEPPVLQVVDAIHQVATVLAELLLLRGISHRDIKPENLYWFGDRACVGDFGLVTSSGDSALTRPDRDLGPRDFLAPEMRRGQADREGPPADVFSLGMTMFALLGGDPPRDGLRADVPQHSLESVRGDQSMYELDLLLRRATAFDSRERPTIEEFATELREFMRPSADASQSSLDTKRHRARISAASRHLKAPGPPQALVDAVDRARSKVEERAQAVWAFLNDLGLDEVYSSLPVLEILDEDGLGVTGGSHLTRSPRAAQGAVWIGAAYSVEVAEGGARFLAGWIVARHDQFPSAVHRVSFEFDPESIADLRKLDQAVAAWAEQANGAAAKFAEALERFVDADKPSVSVVDVREPWLTELRLGTVALPSGEVRVTCHAHLLDDASGVAGRGYNSSPSQLRLSGPGGELLDLMLSAETNRVSGTDLDGFYLGSALVRPDQPDGVWAVEYVLLVDNAGHQRNLYPDDLRSADFPTEVSIAR